jgi:hypothetical protein
MQLVTLIEGIPKFAVAMIDVVTFVAIQEEKKVKIKTAWLEVGCPSRTSSIL